MSSQTDADGMGNASDSLRLRVASEEAKQYAARILANPKGCPMFPVINGHNGAAETLCYMQGYLAGIVGFMGARPTKKEMDTIVHETLCDPNVRDVVVKMQTPVDLDKCCHPMPEY